MEKVKRGNVLFSLEGVIALIVMLATVGALYGNTNTKIQNLEQRLEEYETRVAPMILELTRKTTEIQIAQEGMKSDITWIKANLGEK